MASPRVPFGIGRPPGVSNMSDSQAVSECIAWMVSSVCLGNNTQTTSSLTSMHGSVAQNKAKTLSDKSKISRKRTLDTISSKTLDLVSTSNAKVCKPFWNMSSLGWSKKLWSCMQDLDATCWSSSSKRLAQNSWFTVKMKTQATTATLPMTFLQSQPCLLPPITDVVLQKIANEEEKKVMQAEKAKEKREEKKRQRLEEGKKPLKEKKTYEHPLRARRVRIYPTTEQKATINKWMGAVRFCYNLLVSSHRNVGEGGVTLASMRKEVKDAHEENVWLRKIPGEIKDVAVMDMDKARKAHFAKLKNKKEKDSLARHDASFKFRSKKDPQESFEVRGRDMCRKKGLFSSLGLTMINAAEELPDTVETAVRFVRDRLGRYFLVVPRQVAKRDENQVPSEPESIVSLDPGVRTFQTTYDASGLATEWGKGDMNHIFVLCRKADKMQESWTKKQGSKRRGARRTWYRILDKIKNKVKEIHRKLAVWLCENYKVVLVPLFESSKMVLKGKRKIHTKTARNMLTWSHYSFRELLKTKAELYPWVKVVECDEPYTSKTCGCCGEINSKLGGSKTFHCKKCNYVADRDINGARNIMLRYLSLYHESVSG